MIGTKLSPNVRVSSSCFAVESVEKWWDKLYTVGGGGGVHVGGELLVELKLVGSRSTCGEKKERYY